jgi:FdhD protein
MVVVTHELPEVPVLIRINGVPRIVLSCSPHRPDALALGHLLCEGWIDGPDTVQSLSIVTAAQGSPAVVDIRMEPALVDAGEAMRRHRIEHGCGLRHALDCAPGSLRRDRPTLTMDSAAQSSIFRALFAAATAASPGGGVHAAGLAVGGMLSYTATDVARHCAVDRVIGAAMQDGARLEDLVLVLTSRVSAAIALKAAHAGVAAIMSRSLATSLAHEIATAAYLPVQERGARQGGA